MNATAGDSRPPRVWPAIEIAWPRFADPDLTDLVYARLDDFQPTAIQELERGQAAPAWRVFFPTAEARDGARSAVCAEFADHGLLARALDVDDENWAARSQARLTAVTVGHFIVAPPWDVPPAPPPGTRTLVIEPSMGFGTGHHASTRLCLAALQLLPLEGQRVLDIGTGSGVLAIAAALDGAAEVLALDNDPDALQAARDNVAGNAVGARVRCERADLTTARLPVADVVVANLTGAILTAGLDRLIECVAPGGVLVVSGFTTEERIAHRDGPLAGSPAIDLIERLDEEGWGCLVLRKREGGVSSPWGG